MSHLVSFDVLHWFLVAEAFTLLLLWPCIDSIICFLSLTRYKQNVFTFSSLCTHCRLKRPTYTVEDVVTNHKWQTAGDSDAVLEKTKIYSGLLDFYLKWLILTCPLCIFSCVSLKGWWPLAWQRWAGWQQNHSSGSRGPSPGWPVWMCPLLSPY